MCLRQLSQAFYFGTYSITSNTYTITEISIHVRKSNNTTKKRALVVEIRPSNLYLLEFNVIQILDSIFDVETHNWTEFLPCQSGVGGISVDEGQSISIGAASATRIAGVEGKERWESYLVWKFHVRPQSPPFMRNLDESLPSLLPQSCRPYVDIFFSVNLTRKKSHFVFYVPLECRNFNSLIY